MLSPSEVWSQALVQIQRYVPHQQFDAWFRATRCASLSAEGVRIQVPNQFYADWLRDNYLTLISNTLADILDSPPASVEFSVTESVELATPIGEQGSRREALAEPTAPPPASAQLNPRFTFDTFVVGKSNEFAHAAAMGVSQNPAKVYNPLFVYGGVGLGKTHILQAVGNHIRENRPDVQIYYVSAEKFMNEMIRSIQKGNTLTFKERYRNVDLLLIDDVQFLAGKEMTQEEFFHTFNALYNARKQIVMTSDRPPKDIPNLEERLVSRFEWGLVADIGSPDLETRIAILRKKAELEELSIPDEVLLFIAKSIRSNIRQLEGSLVRLLAFASLSGQDLTVDLAREVLKDFLSQRSNKADIKSILKQVSKKQGIPEEIILSKRRTADVALARQICMYLARELAGLSLNQIGGRLGGRDHTTVLHACQKITKMIHADEKFRADIDGLTDELTA